MVMIGRGYFSLKMDDSGKGLYQSSVRTISKSKTALIELRT